MCAKQAGTTSARGFGWSLFLGRLVSQGLVVCANVHSASNFCDPGDIATPTGGRFHMKYHDVRHQRGKAARSLVEDPSEVT